MKEDAIDALTGLRAELAGAVRRAFFTWLLYAVLATIGLFVVRMIVPGRHELELDIYVLTLGGVALLAVSSALGDWSRLARTSHSSRRRWSPSRRSRSGSRSSTASSARWRWPRAGTSTCTSGCDPCSGRSPSARLERRGVQLDSGSPRVRELLGDELWALTAADREPPGLPLRRPGSLSTDLERTVERLERL